MTVRDIDKMRMDCVEEHVNGREIVIWGAGRNAPAYIEMLRQFGELRLCDTNYDTLQEIGGIPVLDPEILRGRKDKYYVCVSVYKNCAEIVDSLAKYGYEDKRDYCYFSFLEVTDPDNYHDRYGNQVIGRLNGAKVRFLGRNAVIHVQNGFQGNKLVIEAHANAVLEIGRNVQACGAWKLADGAQCKIGDDCRWYAAGGSITVSKNGACSIGGNSRFGQRCVLIVNANTTLQIGEDALFSKLITIRTNDGHPIYNLLTGECVNCGPLAESGQLIESGRKVVLHEHVWVGEGCMLLYQTEIGSGSIVGARSVVKGKFPNNCLIAGHMAKIIRKNVAWSYADLENGVNDLPEEWRRMTEAE